MAPTTIGRLISRRLGTLSLSSLESLSFSASSTSITGPLAAGFFSRSSCGTSLCFYDLLLSEWDLLDCPEPCWLTVSFSIEESLKRAVLARLAFYPSKSSPMIASFPSSFSKEFLRYGEEDLAFFIVKFLPRGAVASPAGLAAWLWKSNIASLMS